MQGRKGASLQSTRRIYRKMRREHQELLQLLAAKRTRPGYRGDKCLTAATVQILEEQLSGRSVPVGVLRLVWQRVCSEEDAKR